MGHGHGIHGGAFRHPAIYELTAAILFGGRRRRLSDDLIELGGVDPGDRVLDVGCGPGYLARRAARAVGPSGRVDGIDPSAEAIAYATRRAPANAAFTVATAERLPHADDTFDVVMSSLALHHIEPEQRPAALSEMRRVLRPDGRLLIVDFGGSDAHAGKGLLGRIGHSTERPTVADLTTLITDAGFVVTGQGDRPHGMCYVVATPERATAGGPRSS
jgi:ubiquinone/menaquinone biosynthesis C-methylase UbiE